MNTGILYLISTPIGNMEDITLRAVKTIGSVDFLLCEDTRRTGLLLQWIEEGIKNQAFIKPRLLSYHEYNEVQRIPEVIELLKNGKNIALVSDAGTPTISDPGFKLVRECKNIDIQVVSIPGSSAILTALTSSGLPSDSFFFIGYLPKKPSHMKERLSALIKTAEIVRATFCFFIPPHDLIGTLLTMRGVFGNINVTLARELTKIHEDVRSKSIDDWLNEFKGCKPKGEFTVLFHSSSLT